MPAVVAAGLRRLIRERSAKRAVKEGRRDSASAGGEPRARRFAMILSVKSPRSVVVLGTGMRLIWSWRGGGNAILPSLKSLLLTEHVTAATSGPASLKNFIIT